MRNASQNDANVLLDVVYNPNESYAEGVARVARQRGITTSGVYGMCNRANNDPIALGYVLYSLYAQGFSMDYLCQLVDDGICTPSDVHELMNAFHTSDRRVWLSEEDYNLMADQYVVTSKLLDAKGQVKSQRAVRLPTTREGLLQTAISTVSRQVAARPERVPAPENFLASHMTVFPLADLHIGLMSVDGIPMEDVVEGYKRAIRALLPTGNKAANGQALIANLGDFTHVDNLKGTTPRGGNKLDVSDSLPTIVETAVELAVWAIDTISQCYVHTDVLWMSGNHDEVTGIVMQSALRQLYANNKTVDIINTQGRFYATDFGETLLAFTHGDTVRQSELPSILATDYPFEWGTSTYRVWHTGHYHAQRQTEYRGCTVEVHGSPAPKDRWTVESGYRSTPYVSRIVYSHTGGEVQRGRVNVYF